MIDNNITTCEVEASTAKWWLPLRSGRLLERKYWSNWECLAIFNLLSWNNVQSDTKSWRERARSHQTFPFFQFDLIHNVHMMAHTQSLFSNDPYFCKFTAEGTGGNCSESSVIDLSLCPPLPFVCEPIVPFLFVLGCVYYPSRCVSFVSGPSLPFFVCLSFEV